MGREIVEVIEAIKNAIPEEVSAKALLVEKLDALQQDIHFVAPEVRGRREWSKLCRLLGEQLEGREEPWVKRLQRIIRDEEDYHQYLPPAQPTG